MSTVAGTNSKTWLVVILAIVSIAAIACEGESITITRATPTADANASEQPATTTTSDGSVVTAVPVDSSGGVVGTSTPLASDPADPASTTSPSSTPDATATPVAVAVDATPTSTSVPPTPRPTSIPTAPAPTASFSSDLRTGAAPLEVVFTAAADDNGESYEWDFGDGQTGTGISSTHQYTVAGNHTVRLTVSGPSGSDTEIIPSYVVVEPGPVVEFGIEPDFATVEVQGSRQFTAVGVDAYGNSIPVEAMWSIEDVDGTIDTTGAFTAGTTAEPIGGTITAAIQSDGTEVVASASVNVSAGPVSNVQLLPAETTVGAQDSISYTFDAKDEFGNSIDDFIVTWSTSGEAGTISSSGGFKASTTAGTYPTAVTVTVVAGTGNASASSSVTITPDILAKVSITPSASSLPWGATENFTALGEDRFGNVITGLAFAWTASGGVVDQNGAYTAGNTVGNYALEASAFSGIEVAGSTLIEIPAPEFFYQRQIGGSFPKGTLLSPQGVAIDSQDNVYVVERNKGRITKFSPDNGYLNHWGSHGSGSGQMDSPHGIAIDSDDNVYVTDTDNHRIHKFTSDGALVTTWGSRGSVDSQFESPWGIAVDGANNVYVVDSANHRVQKFSSNGVFITKWGNYGTAVGQFNSPQGIAAGPSGDIYVSDRFNHRIQRFTTSGGFMSQFGSFGTGDGQFKWQEMGLAVDAAGNVYVSDDSFEGADDRIQKFSANGAYLL
jgi:PKD repeat protein